MNLRFEEKKRISKGLGIICKKNAMAIAMNLLLCL